MAVVNVFYLQFGWTSVMVASKYGHDEVVKELVKRGADLDLTTVSLLNL